MNHRDFLLDAVSESSTVEHVDRGREPGRGGPKQELETRARVQYVEAAMTVGTAMEGRMECPAKEDLSAAISPVSVTLAAFPNVSANHPGCCQL